MELYVQLFEFYVMLFYFTAYFSSKNAVKPLYAM